MAIRTGNARNPSTNYKTSKYCVAYLDILGGRRIIYNDDKNYHLNKINMIFEDALRESKIFAHDIFVKMFSDNILLAVPIEENNRKQNIEKIIVLVSNIIQEVADYGYLMRGAITEGEFFGNNIIAYGKALVDVVKMEEEYAIYPRIIVQKEIAKLLPQYFYLCEDGWHIVNHYVLNIEYFSSLRYKNTLLKQLENNKKDTKISQKIMWAITNFNIIADYMKKAGFFDYPIITSTEIEKATKSKY